MWASRNWHKVIKNLPFQNDYVSLQDLVPVLKSHTLKEFNKSLEAARKEEGSAVRAYMMQLSPNERDKLYKTFENDFLLFDYKPDQY